MGMKIGVRDAPGPTPDVRERTSMDFDSKASAKAAIRAFGESRTCPSCGSDRLKASSVYGEIQKVRLVERQAKKGVFGGTKYRDRQVATLYRVLDVYIDKGGSIRCRGRRCDWRIPSKSGGGTAWLSVNDIIRGISRFTGG